MGLEECQLRMHVDRVENILCDSYFVEFAPTIIHEKNALGAGYIVEFIHDATENYYEGGIYACRSCNNIKFPLYVLKVLKLCLFYLPIYAS